MYICIFCNEEYYSLDGLDNNKDGFFCDHCDSFNLFDETKRSNFTIMLEKDVKEEEKIKQKLPKLSKRLSPLRYPGGKSKAIDQLYLRLKKDKLNTFCSPFSGGASFELALLDAKIINKLILNDKDFGVYSLYYEILNNPERLIKRIKETSFSTEMYFSFREIIKNKYKDCSTYDAAFYTLCNNRMAYSGILKANPIGGKNATNKQLMVRFNIDDISRRIRAINSMKDRIEVYNLDALEIIENYYWEDSCTIFIDPPYFLKGKDLYFEYYESRDHINLAAMLNSLYLGTPCADLLVTYDYAKEIDYLYPNAKKINLNRAYSI